MEDDDDIQPVGPIAKLLNVGPQRVYELCRGDPTFPKIRIGQRQYRFSRKSVLAWCKEGGSKEDSDCEVK
jgi:hypothetical protein